MNWMEQAVYGDEPELDPELYRDMMRVSPQAQQVQEPDRKFGDMVSASSLGLGGQVGQHQSYKYSDTKQKDGFMHISLSRPPGQIERDDAELLAEMQSWPHGNGVAQTKSGKEEKKTDSGHQDQDQDQHQDYGSLMKSAFDSGLIAERTADEKERQVQQERTAKAEAEYLKSEMQFSAITRLNAQKTQEARERLEAGLQLPRPRVRSQLISMSIGSDGTQQHSEHVRKPPTGTYKDTLSDYYLSAVNRMANVRRAEQHKIDEERRAENSKLLLQRAAEMEQNVNQFATGSMQDDQAMTDDLFHFEPVKPHSQKVARLH